MNKRAYCKNERGDEHCVQTPLSNLVKLERHQMWDDSSTEPHHLVNPPSTDCFMNGEAKTYYQGCCGNVIDSLGLISKDPLPLSMQVERKATTALGSHPAPFTKAVCNQRTPVSDSDCFDGGSGMMLTQGISRPLASLVTVEVRLNVRLNRTPSTKAVTHWRPIKVDRVSINVRVARIRQYRPSPTVESRDISGLGSSARFNADSYSRWLLSLIELICWEYIGQKAVDMPRVQRLPKKGLGWRNAKSRVERRSKYSWKRRQIKTGNCLAACRHRNCCRCQPMVSCVLNLSEVTFWKDLIRKTLLKSLLPSCKTGLQIFHLRQFQPASRSQF